MVHIEVYVGISFGLEIAAGAVCTILIAKEIVMKNSNALFEACVWLGSTFLRLLW